MTDEPVLPPLTAKKRRFVEALLTCWNRSQAAREAGYKNANTAQNRLLKQPEVQAAIEERLRQACIGADETLARLSQQGQLNAADFLLFEDGPEGRVMAGINWAEVERRGYLVKSIKYDRKGRPMLEFHDAQNALIQIGRAHGLFLERTENTNLNVAISADELARAREAARKFEKDIVDGSGTEA
jgi:hypothetical protein